jgi:transcriptional regulator with XRE-family HTH domain
MRPSEVFALRLRETREARQQSQVKLAQRMTDAGTPISNRAVRAIERGERGISLDEALAFAAVLNAVPAYLLTPPDKVWVEVTDVVSVDGAGIRAFLRYGFPWRLERGDGAPPRRPRDETPTADAADESRREEFRNNLARLGVAVADAADAGDIEALRRLGKAITAEVDRERERQGGSEDSDE